MNRAEYCKAVNSVWLTIRRIESNPLYHLNVDESTRELAKKNPEWIRELIEILMTDLDELNNSLKIASEFLLNNLDERLGFDDLKEAYKKLGDLETDIFDYYEGQSSRLGNRNDFNKMIGVPNKELPKDDKEVSHPLMTQSFIEYSEYKRIQYKLYSADAKIRHINKFNPNFDLYGHKNIQKNNKTGRKRDDFCQDFVLGKYADKAEEIKQNIIKALGGKGGKHAAKVFYAAIELGYIKGFPSGGVLEREFGIKRPKGCLKYKNEDFKYDKEVESIKNQLKL